MRVIGFHRSSFSFDDGRTSQGMTLYLASDINQDGGAGVSTEKVYLSNQKLNGYIPMLGDEIIIDRAASGTARGVVLLKSAK